MRPSPRCLALAAAQYAARQAQGSWLLPFISFGTWAGPTSSGFNPSDSRYVHAQAERADFQHPYLHPAFKEVPQLRTPVSHSDLHASPQPPEVVGPRHAPAAAHSHLAAGQPEPCTSCQAPAHPPDSTCSALPLPTALLAPGHIPITSSAGTRASTTQQGEALDSKLVESLYHDYVAAWKSRDPHVLSAVQPGQLYQRFRAQLRGEVHAIKDGHARHRRKVMQASHAGVAINLSRPQTLLATWAPLLATALERPLQQVRELANQGAGNGLTNVAGHSVLWPTLALLDTHKTAELTTRVLLQRLLLMVGNPGKSSVVSIAAAVGDAVQDAVRFAAIKQALTRRKNQQGPDPGLARLRNMMAVLDQLQRDRSESKSVVLAVRRARAAADAALGQEPWPRDLHLQVGTELLSLLLPLAIVPDGSLSLAIEQDLRKVHRRGHFPQRVLGPTQALVNYVMRAGDGGQDLDSLLDTRFLPMLVPPKPWQSYRKGGLLLGRQPVIRGYTGTDVPWLKAADEAGHFNKLRNVLDILGSTSWRINTRVLQVVEQLAGNPQYHGTLDLPSRSLVPSPQHPSSALGRTPYLRLSREGCKRGQLLVTSGALLPGEAYLQEVQSARVRQLNANSMSIAAEFDLKLRAARHLAETGVFYQPHSVDFRGRAYPVTGYLTHLEGDISRGLLEFGEGRPLGARGLRWLFIQVANCYGHGKDKLSLDGRHEFGQSCVDKCKATASDPLSQEGRWWQDGEDAWQLLATALEIASAMRSTPATYVSHLPVHQDGSCNGLQHYAALARDKGGAWAVNLIDCAEPQDVYAAVANVVEQRVKQDAAGQLGEAIKLLQRNNNAVDRKLVKQTVMTTVYGVTFIGARDQIAARLLERGWNNAGDVSQVSKYLAQVTLASVGHVFANARLVMAWLADSAKRATAAGHPVSWTSPMGFPIKQCYFMPDPKPKDDTGPRVDRQAQKTAFPPNYVHSLDAAHMMMTALACRKQGLAFAGVHDSFFTHAGTVDNLNRILRREFVELHRQPLLEDLALQLQANGAEGLEPLPSRGELDINCVLTSKYFFS